MGPSKLYSAAAVCLGLAGCAVHPLPENVTGLKTREIVRQIRCEARQAVIDAALTYLTRDEEVDAVSRGIGQEFAGGARPIDALRPSLFRGLVHERFATYWNTGIAYNYTLTATEVNNVDATLDFVRPLSSGLFSLPLSAGLDRQRQNQRTFTITDTFGELVETVPLDYCNNKIVTENGIYPIAGRIGIDATIKDFIRLSLFEHLGLKDKSKGPPTLVDTLDFQTTIAASASPEVIFTPLGRVLRLTDARLAGVASRKDDHQVVIGLALGTKDVRRGPVGRTGLFGGDLLFAAGEGAKQTAAAADDQVLKRRIFQQPSP